MKKKNVVTAVCIVLVAVLIGVGCFGGYVLNRFNENRITAVHSYDEIYSREAVTYDVGEDGEFAVLKINDTHFFDGRYYQLSSVSGYSAVHPADMVPSCTLTVIDVTEEDTQDMYAFSKIEA